MLLTIKLYSPFQSLADLPTPFSQSQCVLHKHELLICGGIDRKGCYSYHILKDEYKFICEYPINVEVQGHCVVKLVENSKDSNQTTLLSFGGNTYTKRHTLMMRYVSVWSNISKKLNKSNEFNIYNGWIPFTDNRNNPIIIGRDNDNYLGLRAVIGGSNNHLLFITYPYNNISVFDLNTFQFIKHDRLPINNYVEYHCFVSKSENGQGQEIMKTNKKKDEMLLFYRNDGLSIEYDENNNSFRFHRLLVCDDIEPFAYYAYVRINDIILFFGGWDCGLDDESVISKSVYKYSIRENKWMTFQNILPSSLFHRFAILSEDSAYVHILGGWNGKQQVPTHSKTKVSEWLNEAEMKKSEPIENGNNEGEESDEEEGNDNEDKNKNGVDNIVKQEESEKQNQVKKDSDNIMEKAEQYKKWKKWFIQREQKDKLEMIEHFKTMSNEQFQVWLLNECKWKNEITKDDINSICVLIDAYLDFTAEDKKGEEVNQLKNLINMEELTFKELLRQSYYCLEATDFEKINEKNLKPQLLNIKNDIIEKDEDVEKEFKNNKPTFKITWISFQHPVILGKTKIIKNALVIMIAISEYIDNTIWSNLPNVKRKDFENFKQLFEQELNYEMICNSSSNMTKDDVRDFMDGIILNFQLRKNTNKYDGLILVICGHGENGNMLVTSDGKHVSIDEMRTSFNCDKMESFKDLPKIFIIDACRGENIPKSHEIVMRGNKALYGHNDDGFLIIWSTTKGHRVADLSLLSECMKKVVVSKYKSGYPFKQMLQDIRTEIRNNKSSEWYCVESQDTTDYDIIFESKKSV
ncbi:hypothetical protein RFI_31453 [Reticulomyxa filosa]|uniref:Caspase family p20 domain-containing protein n=1 Tax=Reticulomyxa filosa TaxID=46433 RepID=X6LWG1_RETFI|nr:hypothetical protein RFI_31453 [Reticulomyxa filosa]|eukprot:ETO05944.1 hypothetical protein RFI_31453 [Reticulomyxa filosa]